MVMVVVVAATVVMVLSITRGAVVTRAWREGEDSSEISSSSFAIISPNTKNNYNSNPQVSHRHLCMD